MAGDWIKMRVDLADDPAVIAMAVDLGITEDAVVGKLHRVWSWADRHCAEGDAPNVTTAWLDRYAGIEGFSDSMCKQGWLAADNGLHFPEFDRHNGKSAKRRCQTAARMRKSRLSDASGVTDPSLEKSRKESVPLPPDNSPPRPTLQDAIAAATGHIGVTAAEAEDWWTAREANGWFKSTAGGAPIPVGTNWQADLKRFTNDARERKARSNGQKNGRSGTKSRNHGTLNDPDDYANV